MFRDNWVRFGFGHDLEEHSKVLPFVIDYSGAAPHPDGITDPLRLAHEACWRIYMDNPGPLVLLVSGGVDSQAMAYAFKTSGVPFEAVTVRYNNGINDYDFGSSSDFYRRHDIPVSVVGLDLLRFHFEELTDYADAYTNNSPHFLAHVKIASLIRSGTVVSSGCIVNQLFAQISIIDYSGFGFERYARRTGKPVIGYFFSYDPHFVHATSLLTPQIRRDPYETKCGIYRLAGFPIQPQSSKLHGFERLKDYFDVYPVPKSSLLRFKDRPSKRPYDLLFRYPLTERIQYSLEGRTKFRDK